MEFPKLTKEQFEKAWGEISGSDRFHSIINMISFFIIFPIFKLVCLVLPKKAILSLDGFLSGLLFSCTPVARRALEEELRRQRRESFLNQLNRRN